MLPWSADLAGRIDELVISSELLRGNPLGDPHERPLLVYLPPGYDDEPDRRYPSVYVIQGYTGYVTMWRNRSAYRQPFPETADAVFARGEAPPGIVVYVDAWTGYGGTQFVDSPGTGRYHSYLCDEVVPFVDARYRTLPDVGAPRHQGQVERRLRRHDHADAPARPVRRARHARGRHAVRVLLHPRVRHRGPAPAPLRRRHLALVAGLQVPGVLHQGRGHVLLSVLGVAACFSANADGTVDLPFDPATGALRTGRVAAVAGLGPGADGASPRGRAARAARHLDRRRARGTSTISTSAPWPSATRSGTSAWPMTCALRAFRGRAHGHRLSLPVVARLALRPDEPVGESRSLSSG